MCVWIIKYITLLCILSNIYIHTVALVTVHLGDTWRVKNTENDYDLTATVPGGIYSDLMKNNIIGDVFHGLNDVETRWVSKINWNYSRLFTVDADLLSHENINLVFDGVDTFSKILINDVEVGTTENMFVRYIFDVKPHLQVGNNHIEVQFKSPVNVAKHLFEKQAENYVVPPRCVPSKYNGECHVNHIRKMQASFAWDWGPAFPSVGIWKTVYLEAYNSTVLRDVTVSIFSNTSTNSWDIQINSYLAENSKSNVIEGTLVVKLLTDTENIIKSYNINKEKNQRGDFQVTQNVSVPKSNVQLWWPNGYGKANLYPLEILFIGPSETEMDIKKLRIGFRTVELVQDAIESGRTFYFKVNNKPLFAKGSNSIPINILPELSQNESTIRFLLQSAKDVHMNMLRVWGGGMYESDTFYELADEMGIMIWQDFMFACSMYPTNDDFIRTVRSEVKHQVRRLQHHPSIVLWAGNNENEAALSQNWYGTIWSFSRYKKDYIKLYVDAIREEVLLNDNTRQYLTSSPTNGMESEEQGHVAINPQSNYYGDVHFYMYLRDSWKKSIYPINRFASEYGYQSLPSVHTLLTATNDTNDLSIKSQFLKNRQHHPMGYFQMQLLINYQLELPSNNSKNFDKAFIFYSQIIQAVAVKTETEYYRQWRSNLNNAGQGLTMGALYWQLNDVWVAPSWAGIGMHNEKPVTNILDNAFQLALDFKNNWKMLHYYAKNFFSPIILTGDLRNNELDIYIVSDLMETVTNATVTVSVLRWDSFIPVHQENIKTDVFPEVSHKIKTYMINTDLFNIRNDSCGEYATKNCFIYFTLEDSNNETIAPDNYVFPVELKKANLQKPILKISNITQIGVDEKLFTIEIKTSAIALFVWLDAKEIRGRFSDNGFLQVIPTKTINFYADHPTEVKDLWRLLTITNLLDNEYM